MIARAELRKCDHYGVCAAAILLLMACTQPAIAQHFGQGMDDGISVWRIVAALLLCSGIAVVAALFLKFRFTNGRTGLQIGRSKPRLQMIEILRIRPQIDLCIVACDGEELLIMTTPQGASLLRPLSHSTDPAAAEVAP